MDARSAKHGIPSLSNFPDGGDRWYPGSVLSCSTGSAGRWLYSSTSPTTLNCPSPAPSPPSQLSSPCPLGHIHTQSLRFARFTFFFSLVFAPGVPWLAPPDMSQVIRHVRSWTSLPSGLRKGGHRKGFSLIDKYRNDEDTGRCAPHALLDDKGGRG